ncbi:hypothetical protein Tco_0594881 [Tanacetum coccineum]
MFEASAIEEVQQQENDGLSNEQGAMIAQILRTHAATAQTRSHLAQASKTQKSRLFHDDTTNQTDDDTANHLCKHDRKENESETICETSQQQTSVCYIRYPRVLLESALQLPYI